MGVTVTEGTQTIIKTTTDTGAEIQHVRNDGGTIGVISSIPNVKVDSGTQQTLGTVGTVIGIGTISNIVTTSGTTTGIGTLSNVGLVDLVTRIGNIGTIESGTVTTSLALNTGTITTIVAGTQNTLGTVGTVLGVGGVVQVSGTVSTGGAGTQPVSFTNDPLGSVVVTVGTIASLPTLNLTTGTITTGSLTNLAMIHNGTLASSGTTTGVGVVTSLTSQSAGTLNTLGTVGVLNSQVAGTLNTLGTVAVVNNIVTGTLASVTMSNIYTGSQVLIAQAVGTTAGTVTGTLSAASGAGTYHWVSGLQIVVVSGTTDVMLGYGSTLTGGSVLARGQFTPGGGIMRDFTFPIRSVGTNSEICYVIAGAGTASIAVNYWKGI